MKPLRSFRSVSKLPAPLEAMNSLARNFWWRWNRSTRELFEEIDPELWEQLDGNPTAVLQRLSAERMAELAADDAMLFRLQRECEAFEAYCGRPPAFSDEPLPLAAYFCAEFALAEFFRIYSGGLGVLAGDHLKASSDLGAPLVGVGLFYHRGYFQQRLTPDGWQMEAYPYNDATQLPMEEAKDSNGDPIHINAQIDGETVWARVWNVDVGRTRLLLLDSNMQRNSRNSRAITDRLYGGDENRRLAQEIMLGIGGARALEALGIRPDVFHMNEGHAALLSVERLRQLTAQGASLAEALERVRASNVFTTHTPVPAGNRAYPSALMENRLRPYLNEIGISWEAFRKLGQSTDDPEKFGMTDLALRMSSYANGVSRLHGDVSRKMWSRVWGELPDEETPIDHITNGVHLPTWVSKEMGELFDSRLGPRWQTEPAQEKVWENVDSIRASELWRAHERCRERLIEYARAQLKMRLRERHARHSEIEAANEALDTETLTIGFARRAATYKRLYLLLRDEARLTALLTHTERPVQLIIAGKSHPDDGGGKEIIQRVIQFSHRPEIQGRLMFLENYNMRLGELMVAGVDIWLNTPRRPHEASGTSGMKAAANGVLNLSVLDGWWAEAYEEAEEMGRHLAGWAIGDPSADGLSDEEIDLMDANLLYETLERDAVPVFYDRDEGNIPREWTRRMKQSIQTFAPRYNMRRTVRDYVEKAYRPAAQRRARLEENEAAAAKELGEWKRRVAERWKHVKIIRTQIDAPDALTAGEPAPVEAEIALGGLLPSDLRVQAVAGRLSLTNIAAPMSGMEYFDLEYCPERSAGRNAVFAGEMRVSLSGHVGVTARVLPSHPNLASHVETGFILWA